MSKRRKTSRCLCSKEMFATSKVLTPKCISMSQQPSKKKTMNSNLTTRCQVYSASLSFCRRSKVKPLNQTMHHLQKTRQAQKEATVSTLKAKRLKENRIFLRPRSHHHRMEERQNKTSARLTLKNRLRKTKKARNFQAKKLDVLINFSKRLEYKAITWG